MVPGHGAPPPWASGAIALSMRGCARVSVSVRVSVRVSVSVSVSVSVRVSVRVRVRVRLSPYASVATHGC